MQYQFREYEIRLDAMAEWLSEWRRDILRLRHRLGFQVIGAWPVADANRFVWVLGWDGPGSFENADRACCASLERAAIQPDPARHMLRSQTRLMRSELADQ